MSDDAPADIPALEDDSPKRAKPRVRKLRLLLLLVPLAALAIVSTLFGMMMAVASDLPALENRKEYQEAQNSYMTDVHGRPIGVLANNQHRILVDSKQIAAVMKFAVVSVEDERFYENSGVDLKAMGRAFFQDVVQQRAAQGGSTITQQFVKNAMQAQTKRTVFEKLREAALAYHLTRKWSKDKILTQYLNSIYYGNGAYGIESAARTYFGWNHPGCGEQVKGTMVPCAETLYPAEAAMLAGIIQSPSGNDPVAHPKAALDRRNVVLKKMLQQGHLRPMDYRDAVRVPVPTRDQVRPPSIASKTPYFASWVRQQLVDKYGARKAFEGGLKVQTTIDLDLQKAAEQSIKNYLGNPEGPTASMVVIDNKTGEVRAMVGGQDYQTTPFNLATQGRRQPGSAMKPFILATALSQGIGVDSTWVSEKKVFKIPDTHPVEYFPVKNDIPAYNGPMSLGSAMTYSDNTVYSEVGIQVGTKQVAKTAWKMGIRSPISTNYAMTLGGLKTGVSPLDMAHAYETIATGGDRINGTLGAPDGGPVGIRRVTVAKSGKKVDRNRTIKKRVIDPANAEAMKQVLQTVVTSGTARRAQLGDGQIAAGKTGTTSGYGDAWFVGFTERYTVAVWVGYPNSTKSMETDFEGSPVEGGTFPALIWHDFMVAAGIIDADREARRAEQSGKTVPDTSTVEGDASNPVPSPDTQGGGGDTSSGTSDTGGTGGTGGTTGGGTGDTGGGGTTGGGDTGGGTGGGGTGGGDTGGGTAPAEPTAPSGGGGGDSGGAVAPSG